jgi:UDP-glucose 4-epimerase
MKVLVSGALGNIGAGTVEQLLSRGHRVRCFDIFNRSNEKKAAGLPAGAEMFWGDLRNPRDVFSAVEGMDVVIHLAFVVPKLSATGIDCEDEPDWAWEVNVGGTRNMLEAMKAWEHPPRIIFASSLHVYGITADQPPPRRVSDRLKPLENYARHKVECERLVRSSGLSWSIFRLAAALPFSLKLDPAMFEIPLGNRMEYVHNRDVGLALAKGVANEQIWGKVLHIGGGPRCWYTYGQIVGKVLDCIGIGMLPEQAFSGKPFSTDWIDTEESQSLLRYQRYTLDDYLNELSARLGLLRPLARIFRPLVRAALLARSPYYRVRRFARQRQEMRGKLALVTCAASSFGEAVARKLAQEGLRVLLIETPGEDLGRLAFQIREEGGRVETLRADLSRSINAARMFRKIDRSCGPVEILVNQAGLVWPYERTDSLTFGGWERIERDLLGIIRLSELVLENMKRRGRGQLIFLEPALKLLPVRPTALLHGMRSFYRVYMKSLNRELIGSPVRVSLVKTGIPTTELLSISRLLSVFSRRRGYGLQVRPEVLANKIWVLIIKPQAVIYIPHFIRLFSWLETYAGWLVELMRRRFAPARVDGSP